jgi:hypothetical protein
MRFHRAKSIRRCSTLLPSLPSGGGGVSVAFASENASTHHVEGSAPACLVEEMKDHAFELLHAIRHAGMLFIFLG